MTVYMRDRLYSRAYDWISFSPYIQIFEKFDLLNGLNVLISFLHNLGSVESVI